MQRYDLYVFAPDGPAIIIGWHKIEARDDDAAVEAATGLNQSLPNELWFDGNLVQRWAAQNL